jgi:putative transcriptional regulator
MREGTGANESDLRSTVGGTPVGSGIYDYHKKILDYRNVPGIILDVAIEVRLDLMLARRKMRLTELSNRVGISMTNLSLLKTGKVKAIRFSTLEALCRELECQPGDLLEFVPEHTGTRRGRVAS